MLSSLNAQNGISITKKMPVRQAITERREKVLQEFAAFRVTPDMVFRVLGVGGQQDITLDHLVVLTGILTALRDGDAARHSERLDEAREHLDHGQRVRRSDGPLNARGAQQDREDGDSVTIRRLLCNEIRPIQFGSDYSLLPINT